MSKAHLEVEVVELRKEVKRCALRLHLTPGLEDLSHDQRGYIDRLISKVPPFMVVLTPVTRIGSFWLLL